MNRCGQPSDPEHHLTCDLPAGHEYDPDIGAAHGNYAPEPGRPCYYCGQLTPTSGVPCPNCWEDAGIADLADAHLEAWTAGGDLS